MQGIVMASVPAREIAGEDSHPATVKMIPYYAWNNRGEDSMIVWVPQTQELAAKSIDSALLAKSKYGQVLATHTKDGDSVSAVVDGIVPSKSSDQAHPRWTSLPFKNRHQDITVTFPKSTQVESVSVYWYENPENDVKVPREWWIDYKVGDGDWKRMEKYVTDFYGLEKDTFNFVRPEMAMECDAIRIGILPQQEHCMGIHEIQLGIKE